VRIADMNGDGRLDLATAGNRGKSVSIRLNRPGLCNVQDAVGLTLASADERSPVEAAASGPSGAPRRRGSSLEP
jgi:hypothetical protein